MISENHFGFYEASNAKIPETIDNLAVVYGDDLTLRQGAKILARLAQAKQYMAHYGDLRKVGLDPEVRYSRVSKGTNQDGSEYALLMFESEQYHNALAVSNNPFGVSRMCWLGLNICLTRSRTELVLLFKTDRPSVQVKKLHGVAIKTGHPFAPTHADARELTDEEVQGIPNMIGAFKGAVLETDLYLGHTKRWFAKIDISRIEERIDAILSVAENVPDWKFGDSTILDLYAIATGKPHPSTDPRECFVLDDGYATICNDNVVSFGNEQMLFEEFSSDLADARLYPKTARFITPMATLVAESERLFKTIEHTAWPSVDHLFDLMASRGRFEGL